MKLIKKVLTYESTPSEFDMISLINQEENKGFAVESKSINSTSEKVIASLTFLKPVAFLLR